MLKRVALIVFAAGMAAVAVCSGPPPAAAESYEARRERVNQGTVTIISGGVSGTYVRIASDLAAVLDDGDRLRVLPVLGKGSLQNIADLLYLRGIDVAIVQSDVLRYVREKKLDPRIERRIRYVAKLYNEEVHVLARADVATFAGLAGKKVNFDVDGSGTAMTATTIFGLLGMRVQPTHFEQALALEKLKSGEIAAMLYVVGKPTELFKSIDADSGLHFLAIPPNPALLETYLPSTIETEDYPKLIKPGSPPLETVSVGAVMAVNNPDSNSERARRVDAFVEAFFERFDKFLQPPRHPKWQEVNLAAAVPGWTRLAVADAWLARQAEGRVPTAHSGLRTSFDDFLAFMTAAGLRPGNRALSDKEREALFARYLEWSKAQDAGRPPAPAAPAAATPFMAR
ncbi:MAG: TAXI family TRAP transporter solute-binding subunit [Rhodospirillales bacterium]